MFLGVGSLPVDFMQRYIVNALIWPIRIISIVKSPNTVRLYYVKINEKY